MNKTFPTEHATPLKLNIWIKLQVYFRKSATNYRALWTEHAAPSKSTKSRNSDSSVSCSTNLNWDFSLIWIFTGEFVNLDLVDFGRVTFSVESVIDVLCSATRIESSNHLYWTYALSCRSFSAKEPLFIVFFCASSQESRVWTTCILFSLSFLCICLPCFTPARALSHTHEPPISHHLHRTISIEYTLRTTCIDPPISNHLYQPTNMLMDKWIW